MDDIVTRLGRTKFMQDADIETLCDEAAAEIERLRASLLIGSLNKKSKMESNIVKRLWHASAYLKSIDQSDLRDIIEDSADVIEKLQTENEILKNKSSLMSYDLLKADEKIEDCADLIKQLVPYMVNDVKNGLYLGPSEPSHNDNCDDCNWYQESLAWKEKIASQKVPYVTLDMLEW